MTVSRWARRSWNSPPRLAGSLACGERSDRVLRGLHLDRQVVPVAPLLPGAVIVRQLGAVVADQCQREQVVRRAHADLAIDDHAVAGGDAAIAIELLNLGGALERLRRR